MDVVAPRVLIAVGALAAVAAVGACGSSSSPPAALEPVVSTSPAASPNPPALPDGDLVAEAHWTEMAAGYRLRVRPSRSGRVHAADHPTRALDQALAAAGPHPLTLAVSIRRSLWNQLKCHAIFAMHKPWWDLETWRPDVGFTKTVFAACNP